MALLLKRVLIVVLCNCNIGFSQLNKTDECSAMLNLRIAIRHYTQGAFPTSTPGNCHEVCFTIYVCSNKDSGERVKKCTRSDGNLCHIQFPPEIQV